MASASPAELFVHLPEVSFYQQLLEGQLFLNTQEAEARRWPIPGRQVCVRFLFEKQPRAAKLVQLLKVFAATPEALFGPQDPCDGKK